MNCVPQFTTNKLNIPFQALISGALHGGVLEQCVKVSFRQVFPVVFSHGQEPFRRLKLGLFIGQGKTVIRTHILADVAAIHPAFEGFGVHFLEAAFVFNSQVGDALACVDAEGSFQSMSRAGIDAFRAAAAAVGELLAGFGKCYGQKLVPYEEERASTLSLTASRSQFPMI